MMMMVILLLLFTLASIAQSAPQGIVTTVTVTNSCYVRETRITISFAIRIPRPNDLIGIALANNTKSLLLSTPLCSSSSACTKPIRSGNVSLVLHRLPTGLPYKAVVLRPSSPGRVMASSSPFAVTQSTCAATTSPSLRPTPRPTPVPTVAPTPAPTPPPTEVASGVLIQAEILISGLVQNNPRLSPEFIRMGFHDCIGGCDGCIDLSNPDNNGLAHPISVLEPIVKLFADPKTTGLTRTDIWALASMVGANVAPKGTLSQAVPFKLKWIGRVDCEDANAVCQNNQGQVVACNATQGPGRTMPSPNLDSQGVFNYFADNFGFNQRQTVTIMGAHTMGRLQKLESGFDGTDGWVIDNTVLQNEYYNALMGVASASTPVNQITSICPDWARKFTNNEGTGIPDRNGWSLNVKGKALTMLDTDVGLVRSLSSGNNLDPSTGAVSCAFSQNTAQGSQLCPLVSTISTVEEFAADNDSWTNEFAAVMDLMLTNGYDRNSCSEVLCRLTPQ